MFEEKEAWSEAITKEAGCYGVETFCSINEHGVRDTRPGPWMRLPLSDYFGPLSEARQRAAGTPQEKTLKAFINATFGALASPFFEMNHYWPIKLPTWCAPLSGPSRAPQMHICLLPTGVWPQSIK